MTGINAIISTMEAVKEGFNKHNKSIVYSVQDNYRINVHITDRAEKRIFCGCSGI